MFGILTVKMVTKVLEKLHRVYKKKKTISYF